MLILGLKGLSLVVAYESRMTAEARFLIQPSRIEWYIFSKKSNESLLSTANYW